MSKKTDFPFKIQAVNTTDYLMEITLNTDKKQFDMLLHKSLAALSKVKDNVPLADAVDQPDIIDIPDRYLQLIRVAMRKPYIAVKEVIKDDPIELLDYNVKSCQFKKTKSGGYDIEVLLWGRYKKK